MELVNINSKKINDGVKEFFLNIKNKETYYKKII